MRRDFEIAPTPFVGATDPNYDFSHTGDPTWIEIPPNVLGNNITEVELRVYFNQSYTSLIYYKTYEVVNNNNVLIEFGREVVSMVGLQNYDMYLRYEVVVRNDNTPIQEWVILYGDLVIISPYASGKEIEEE